MFEGGNGAAAPTQQTHAPDCRARFSTDKIHCAVVRKMGPYQMLCIGSMSFEFTRNIDSASYEGAEAQLHFEVKVGRGHSFSGVDFEKPFSYWFILIVRREHQSIYRSNKSL